ncbi:ac5 [Senna leaf curl virus]|uniref:Ac5 n=1 Tax=Senna leaf curl virus TaxID=1884991 RepID=A0A1B1ZGC7_9GEMI|nr:ac5 [Senna leaf curl virus]ANX99785.1 ac5 [Senna leaf curl virus]
MGACHVQHQSILTMVLILASFLLVINDIIVNPNKLLHESLFFSSILPTGNRSMPFTKNLITVTMNILHSCSTWLVVKHVEDLAKILRLVNRTTVTYQKEHYIVSVVLSLDILIHPYLP